MPIKGTWDGQNRRLTLDEASVKLLNSEKKWSGLLLLPEGSFLKATTRASKGLIVKWMRTRTHTVMLASNTAYLTNCLRFKTKNGSVSFNECERDKTLFDVMSLVLKTDNSVCALHADYTVYYSKHFNQETRLYRLLKTP